MKRALHSAPQGQCTLFSVLCFFCFFFVQAERALGQNSRWVRAEGYRFLAVAPSNSAPGFAEFSGSALGIHFSNSLPPEVSLTNQIYLNGSGVAAGDVNGDDLPDLYFCAIDGTNRLYRNLGNFRFQDITAEAGVGLPSNRSSGAAFADLDNDSDLDLLVNGIGTGTRLFLNDGSGKFTEVEQSGFSRSAGSSSLAIADFDRDGLLDVFVVNYRVSTLRDEPGTKFTIVRKNGRMELQAVNGISINHPSLAGRFSLDPDQGVLENGEAPCLYRNLGKGKFAAVSWTNGAFLDWTGKNSAIPYGWGLSAAFGDVNGDGAPDLYVCNDFQNPDYLWINDGKGVFRQSPPASLRHTSLFSMGVDFADLDRDGRTDFFVVDMLSPSHLLRHVQVGFFSPMPNPEDRNDHLPQYSRNTLFWNRTGTTFSEVADLSGLSATDWSWCPVFLDVDLDGFEDLLVVTGHERDAQNSDVARELEKLTREKKMSEQEQILGRARFPRLDVPNYAFRNLKNLQFRDESSGWGFSSKRISQGICLADLDLDGDADLVINCLNDEPLIYRNNISRPRLSVRLKDERDNVHGIGARITVVTPGMPVQTQTMIAGGRYLSSDEPFRTFALQDANAETTVEVNWPSGRQSRIRTTGNRLVTIEGRGKELPTSSTSKEETSRSSSLFQEQNELLNYTHEELVFDDFALQPLLPKKLSSGGPLAIPFDYDLDGWIDLIIGGGRGGSLAVFRNTAGQGFRRVDERPWNAPLTRDISGMTGWITPEGKTALILAQSNYEDRSTNGVAIRILRFDGTQQTIAAGLKQSIGALALGDADGDGDLDLFAGGRVEPGKFPERCESILYLFEENSFKPLENGNAALSRLGMVSDACWADLNNDGRSELVVGLDAGWIRILSLRNGEMQDVSSEWKMPNLRGFWTCLGVGDFNNDGRIDLVAGNWGRNTWWNRSGEKPLRFNYTDFNNDGVVELLESYWEWSSGRFVPWQEWPRLGKSFPVLHDKISTFKEFASRSSEEIMGLVGGPFEQLELNYFESALFLNRRGTEFEVRPLPKVSQISPVSHIAVSDFNGDGNHDLWLSQNFYGVPPDRSRFDAGQGVILLGKGNGDFAPLEANESGMQLHGEMRSAVAADFDKDGRTDLFVGIRHERARYGGNVGGRVGPVVRWEGPAGNRQAIGAMLRVIDGASKPSPAWPVTASSGGAIVLPATEKEQKVEITWPGGKRQTNQISSTPGKMHIFNFQKE
jgi:hypothetical protein